MEAAANPDAPQPKKPKRLLKLGLIFGGFLVIAGGGGAAGIYATRSGLVGGGAHEEKKKPLPKLVERSEDAPEKPAEGGADAPRVAKVGTVEVANDRHPIDEKRFEATYIPIDQSFTANLADGSGFIQAGLTLATYYDDQVVQNIERQQVPIRSAILLVLSNQDGAAVSTPQGKQRLQRELTDAINHVLRRHEGFGGVHNVFFSSLVVQ